MFFNVSPIEASVIDPQERLFMETVWECLEDAGYSKSSLSGSKTGVFAGVMWGDYQLIGARQLKPGMYNFTTSSRASVSSRISYFFDWRGPSLTLDTMCSSSLVAISLACDSLRSGDSELAVAGGVNVCADPYKYLLISQSGFVSSDGRCRSFGSGGDGYVPGEGVGAVLLKPLEKAIDDGDRVYGVIKSAALNHGGKTAGYSVPNPLAQGEVIRQALEKGGVDPQSLSYIEAHGTGTSLGDPIEINGLKRAFGQQGEKDKQYCAIGSVKSNIGHLESAAGIVGLTKVLLQMKHKQLAPSIHSEALNPRIDFENSPFYVQRELSEWTPSPRGDGGFYPLRAGLSSFGASGANAHLIVEEHVSETSASVEFKPPFLIILSAKNKERLKQHSENLLQFMEKQGNENQANFDSKDFVESFLARHLAELINISESEIDREASFEEQGIDMFKIEQWQELLEETYSIKLDSTIFMEHPSLDSLSGYLSANLFGSLYSLGSKSLKLSEAEISETSIADIAYTLQVGREAMEERLAMLVENTSELCSKLKDYLKTGRETSGLYLGNVKKGEAKAELLVSGEAGELFMNAIIKNREIDKLARLWVEGVQIDWRLLYEEARPGKISLPTYPFAKESHWVKKGPAVEAKSLSNVLHPLLDAMKWSSKNGHFY